MSKGKFTFMLENYKEQGLKKLFTLDEGWDEMMAAVKKKHKEEKGTGTFDKKKVSTGTVYTKKVNKDGSSKMKEEVENIGEASTYKLGRAAAETKDFPIHHNGEHVGRLEFHTSAGKLHHRVSSIAGVPHEKFIGHPDREKMTNTHVAKHEDEARKHFAKKIKEEVELDEELKGKQHKIDKNKNGKIDAQDFKMLRKEEEEQEESEQLEEREMTDTEMKKREDIVKGMKKGMQGFKDRYGDKAKNVMYATATKQAMKD
jgi:hypothetical protein